jgi:hypothetical protein
MFKEEPIKVKTATTPVVKETKYAQLISELDDIAL